MTVLAKYQPLTAALRQSVEQAASAGDPAALTKALDAFEEALGQQLNNDLPLEPTEVDPILYAADAVAQLAKAAEAIEAGACAPIAGMQPSEDSVMLLKAAQELGDLAVSAIASDYAAPIEEGEQPGDGEALHKVETTGGEVLVKTVLPAEMVGLVAAPVDIADAVADFGFGLLEMIGVTPEPLGKKAPPFAKKGKSGEEDPEDGDPEDGDPEDGDPEDGDPEDGDPELDPEMEDPLENIAQLATAIVVEVASMKKQMGPAAPMPAPAPEGEMGPDGQPMEGGGGGDPVVSAIDGMGRMATLIATLADSIKRAVDSPEPAAADEEAEKAAQVADLAKGEAASGEAQLKLSEAEAALAKVAAEKADLEQRLAKANEAVEQLRREPMPATGAPVLRDGGGALAKGGEPVSVDAQIAQEVEELSKLTPEQQSLALFKRALGKPIVGVPGSR